MKFKDWLTSWVKVQVWTLLSGHRCQTAKHCTNLRKINNVSNLLTVRSMDTYWTFVIDERYIAIFLVVVLVPGPSLQHQCGHSCFTVPLWKLLARHLCTRVFKRRSFDSSSVSEPEPLWQMDSAASLRPCLLLKCRPACVVSVSNNAQHSNTTNR